jgi:hypothetical protein
VCWIRSTFGRTFNPIALFSRVMDQGRALTCGWIREDKVVEMLPMFCLHEGKQRQEGTVKVTRMSLGEKGKRDGEGDEDDKEGSNALSVYSTRLQYYISLQ